MKNCIFAGSFDPITKGHKDIIDKCLKLFDKVLIIVGDNTKKKTFFTLYERLEIVKALFGENDRVIVRAFSQFSSTKDFYDFLIENDAYFYVRGLRDTHDFTYERAQEKVNKELYPKVTTIYITCDDEDLEISSTAVREKILEKKDFSSLVPDGALATINKFIKG